MEKNDDGLEERNIKMKKFKMFAIGLVVSVVFSSFAIVGASAATPLSAATSTLTSTSSSLIVSGAIATSNLGIITPDFNYGPMGGPSIETIIADGGLVQIGDVGYAVWELQGYLNSISSRIGYHTISQDGYFGNDTLGAVKAVQYYEDYVDSGNWYLSIDGIVGPVTLSHIMDIIMD